MLSFEKASFDQHATLNCQFSYSDIFTKQLFTLTPLIFDYIEVMTSKTSTTYILDVVQNVCI